MTSRLAAGLRATLAAVIAFLAAPALRADLPAHFDPRTMLPVSEVKPGMKGIGKTVFRGVEISDFPVEVIGVVPKYDLGGDLILVRVTGGPLLERQCGVVGGMSGSPVFLDGRLAGAVAYTWPFEKEPIGGVTPIESMLHAYVEATPAPKTTAAPVMLHGRTLTAARIAEAGETRPFADPTTINLVPVGLMACSGFSRRALADLAEFTGPYGLEPSAGPGALDKPVKTDLVPGAAVSVELQRGDFSISLIGTVTYREGDRLLAFGHPFMQLGAVDFPVATAYVHDFVPAYSRTDKIASAMELVGSLRQDGAWSVGGLVGPVAKMVPVEVSVADENTGRRRDFHVEVAREKTLTQALVAMSVGNAIEAGFRPGGEGTARVRYQVEGERGARVTRENLYWDGASIAAACAREMSSTIYVLRRNPFEPQEPARVRIEVSLSDRNSGAAIEEVYTDETVAKAGEKVTVHVVLRPWNAPTFEKVVELKLPKDLQRGTLRLGVCGGDLAYGMRARLGLVQPDFHDLPAIIEDMEKTELNNQLYVGAALPNTAIGVAQYLLNRFPSSISGIMEDSRTTDVSSGREEVSRLIDCEHVILGQAMLTLNTEDRTGARPSTPPPSPSEGPPSSGPSKKASSPEPPARRNPLTAPPLGWAQDLLARSWPVDARPKSEPSDTPPPAPKATPPATDAEPKEKPETPSEPEEGKDEDKDKEPLTRALFEWRQDTESDFREGKPEGIAIRSDGALYLALKETRAAPTDDHRSVWSVAADPSGPVYVGAGRDGRVYRLVEGSGPELLCRTGQLAVHALTLSGSRLYAGTIPSGRLYKIDPAKPDPPELIATLPDKYLWALLPDREGGVYVGTGSEGRLYHVTAKGEATVLATLPAQHVLALASLGEDLLAGTAEGGVVYRVKPDGHFEALYDDESPAVTGVAVTSTGEAYACTGEKGHVVRITPGKEPETLLKLDEAASAMAAVGDAVYVATTDEGQLLAVLPGSRTAVAGKVKASDASCLAAAGTRLIAGSANPGRVTVFDAGGQAEGSFLSAMLDAERPARWGSVLWTGEVPADGSLELRLRTGATADPDDGTWGPWSYAYPGAAPASVLLPPARYLQYRVTMRRADGSVSPVLDSLLLKYLPANQEPTVKVTAPLAGASISGKYEIKWDASDPDDDDLRYALYVRREGATEWTLLAEQLDERKFEWNTTKKVDEGTVALRVVASDAVPEPADPLTKEALVFPVVIDNTPPKLWPDGDPQVNSDRTVTLKGAASDRLSPIVSVEYQIGSKGKWLTARPVDGLLDTPEEHFELRTAPLEPGQRVITVRIRDAAGNKKSTSVSVVIPGEKKEPKVVETPQQDAGRNEGRRPRKGRG